MRKISLMKNMLLAASLFFLDMNSAYCQMKLNSGQQAAGGKITVEEFEQKLNSNTDAQIVDVRSPEEFARGHVKDAKNITWGEPDFENQINELDKTMAVFIYCRSGDRTAAPIAKMKELGFKEIYEIQGGMMAWSSAGKTVVYPGLEKRGMNLDEYNQRLKSDKLVLVDFNAPWCAPCNRMVPILDELAKEQKNKMQLVTINIDENKDLAKTLKVTSLPLIILYKDKKVVWQNSGFIEKKELEKILRRN